MCLDQFLRTHAKKNTQKIQIPMEKTRFAIRFVFSADIAGIIAL